MLNILLNIPYPLTVNPFSWFFICINFNFHQLKGYKKIKTRISEKTKFYIYM